MIENLQFIKKFRIRSADLYNDMTSTLTRVYGQSRDAFTYSSSWGMILLVVNNHYQLIMSYLQDAITESNPLQAKRNNSIYGNAAAKGYSPVRNRAAVGEIFLRYKGDPKRVKGDKIFVPNLSRLKNQDNLLTYSLDLKRDDVTINLSKDNKVYMKIIEGVWDFQRFTGTGEDYQTYEVNSPVGQQVDQDNYVITVNGEQVKIFDGLRDIPFGVLGCVVTTGIFSGIDLFFGNEGIHKVPELGAELRVDFLVSNGLSGNNTNKDSIYEFTDTGFDVSGATVDLNEIFEVKVSEAPILGSNAEPPELTRRLAPQLSRYTVLHDDTSIEFWFRRLNLFNVVKVMQGDEAVDQTNINQYKVLLIPKTADRITSNEDYFTTDIDNFLITKSERTRLMNAIDESGIKSSSISISIIQPKIRKYILNIFVEAFETFGGLPTEKHTLKQNIKDAISDYLINNQRLNKIPHSDIVKIVDNVDAVDTIKAIYVAQDGDNNEYGIDNKGNIKVADNEIAMIRGGWTDVEDVSYEDSFNIENDKPSSVNIFIEYVKPI